MKTRFKSFQDGSTKTGDLTMSIKKLPLRLSFITLITALTMNTVSMKSTINVIAEENHAEFYSVGGNIAGFSALDDTLLPLAVVSITPVDSKTPKYVTTGYDNYSFENVEPGEYVLAIAARGEYVTHEYELIIDDSDVVKDIAIYQLGDINHDGIISAYDSNSLSGNGINSEGKERNIDLSYERELADVNHDGSVDQEDILLVKQYSSGQIKEFPKKKISISEKCKKEIDRKLSVDENHILDSTELIVTFDEEFPLEYIFANHEVKSYEVFIGENDWGINPFVQIGFYDDYSIEEEAALIAENDHILSIHPHYFTEMINPVDELPVEEAMSSSSLNNRNNNINDPFFIYQAEYYSDMGLPGAWDLVNENMIRKAKIAIIDCDLNYNHPDLVNVIDQNKCFDAMNYESEGPWWISGSAWSPFTLYPYTPTNMLSHHGTAVASLIAAEANNLTGIAGAASAGTNHATDIYFYNCATQNDSGNLVLDMPSIYRSLICAISEDVDVINMSYGIHWTDNNLPNNLKEYELLQAAYNQGIALVAAGGNDGSIDSSNTSYHVNGSGANYLHTPSDFNECIAVSSLRYSYGIPNHDLQIRDSKYRRAVYSSYNNNKDISAFGTNVYYALSNNANQNGYASGSGTSFAAPVITSIVALMKSVNPMLSNEQIFDILTMTAADLTYSGNIVNKQTGAWGSETAGRGYDIYTGYGMVNAERCVEEALQLLSANHTYFVYPNNVSIPTNSNYQLTGKVVPDNLYNNNFTWSSSDSAIASVNQNGVVTAHRYGTVTITSTSSFVNTLSDTVTVQTRYYDVNDISKYYYDSVYWAADNDITRGYDNVYFSPDGVCDRKAIVLFLWRMSGRPNVQGTVNFSDVNYDHTTDTYKAILWASAQGIANGYPNGTFCPDNPVTRKDAMIMLYRTAGSPAVNGTMPYPDVTALNYPANSDSYKSILWAYNTGITHVAEGGNFGPLDNCTRAEIVTFLYRYVNL